MAVYLDEDDFGTGSELCFPNLRSCMGVVLWMDDGTLMGCHVAGGGSEDGLIGALKTKKEGHGGNVKDVYFIGDLSAHIGFGQSIGAKIQALQVNGMITKVDLRRYSRPSPGVHNGILARVRSNGAIASPTLLAGADPGGHAYTKTMANRTVTTKDKGRVTGTGQVASARWYTTGDNVVGLEPVPQTCYGYLHIH